MIRFVVDNPLSIQKYQSAFEKRGVEGYFQPKDKYLLTVEGNRMWLNPLLSYQCDMKAFTWETMFNIVESYRMEPIVSVDEVHKAPDTIHMLIAKLMVFDIPDDKLVQAIKALHPGYQPSYKVVRNYLTDGLMFKWVGEDPEEVKRLVEFSEYIGSLFYDLTDCHQTPFRVEGRDYGPQPHSIRERLAQAKVDSRP